MLDEVNRKLVKKVRNLNDLFVGVLWRYILNVMTFNKKPPFIHAT
jgi:hypothetical protein